MSSSPKNIRWGILATGGIAKAFAKDLTIDPKTRGVTILTHTITAAASSTSADRARAFLTDVGAPTATPHSSYAALAADPAVDIIYIATPHSHHYQNALLCLRAGKHVLCEKAFTVNAAQARVLVATARANNLLLIEGVWTRYFPLSGYVRETITSGRVGRVERVAADLSVCLDLEQAHAEGDVNRMVSPELAGGALLDLGIYALTWVFMCLYTVQDEGTRRKPGVSAHVTKYAHTGVDRTTSMLLTFPRREGDAQGVATTSMVVSTDADKNGSAGPAVRVYGEKGEIVVYFPTFRPTRTKVVLQDGTAEEKVWEQPGPGKGSGFYNGFGSVHEEGVGHGMFWEADEAGYALLEGRKEGRWLGWEESCTIMEVMDEVRRQGGIKYPEKIETTDFPVEL